MVDIRMALTKISGTISRLDAEILFAHAIKKPKEFLYTYPEYKLALLERLRLAYFLFLYKRGYSVAAITHHKEFYGLDFYVNQHTLIPRPETELIVEEAIKTILDTKYQILNTTLIDIGTGSGCILIAILSSLKQFNNLTIKPFAIDISHPALRVARKNARTHNVFINFFHGNLLKPLLKNYELRTLNSELIIITTNLPYLTAKQFDSEPSIQREPRSALVANNGGLALYEKLLRQTQSLCLMLRVSCYVFLEIDPSQSSHIISLIKKYLPQSSIEIKTDLAGRDRMVKISLQ